MGEYRLVRALGRGAMGEVWLAQHRQLKRDVALKFLHEVLEQNAGLVERFRREAGASIRIAHPGVVRVYDYGESDGCYYLAMELLQGGSDLAERLAAGPLAPAAALKAVRELLEAVEACHQAGVLHRDLKPANVHLDAEGRLRVLDLGLAKQVDRTVLTEEGSRVGTPRYMAPELIRGAPCDARADLYQVGLILHEMIAGQSAFPQRTVRELVAAILTGALQPLPEVPGPHGRLLGELRDKLCANDPEERFQSATAALAWLAEQLLAGRRDTRSPRRTGSMKSFEGGATAARSGPGVPLVPVALVLAAVAALVLWRLSGSPPVLEPTAARSAAAARDLEVECGPTSCVVKLATARAVTATASLDGTGRTTSDAAPAVTHALGFTGLTPGQAIAVTVTTPDAGQVASWSGALPTLAGVRLALFDLLAFTDDTEPQLVREIDRDARDLKSRAALANRWKIRLGAVLRQPRAQRVLAQFAQVEERIGEDPAFSYEHEAALTSRRERLRSLQFWLLRDTGVDTELPWSMVAQKVWPTLPPDAVPLIGAEFGDGGRAGGRRPLDPHPQILRQPGDTRFHHSGGFLDSADARTAWTLERVPSPAPCARAWVRFRMVSSGPCAKISVRWVHGGVTDEIAYLWGSRAGEVVEGCIPVDQRMFLYPGRLALLTVRRSNALVASDTLVDHVVLYGRRSP